MFHTPPPVLPRPYFLSFTGILAEYENFKGLLKLVQGARQHGGHGSTPSQEYAWGNSLLLPNHHGPIPPQRWHFTAFALVKIPWVPTSEETTGDESRACMFRAFLEAHAAAIEELSQAFAAFRLLATELRVHDTTVALQLIDVDGGGLPRFRDLLRPWDQRVRSWVRRWNAEWLGTHWDDRFLRQCHLVPLIDSPRNSGRRTWANLSRAGDQRYEDSAPQRRIRLARPFEIAVSELSLVVSDEALLNPLTDRVRIPLSHDGLSAAGALPFQPARPAGPSIAAAPAVAAN